MNCSVSDMIRVSMGYIDKCVLFNFLSVHK